VGRWLTQTILAAASEELRSKRGEDSQQKQPGTGASFSFAGEPSKVPEAANQAPEAQPPAPQQQQMQQPQQTPQYQPNYAAPPVSSGPPALTPEAVLASIQKLASRIEESEQRTADVLKPIADKVGDLSVQIEDIKTKSGGNSASVERAMMRLSERLDRMEEPGKGTGSRPSKTSSSSGVMSRLFGRD
jgi:hypothetical protein